MNRLLIFIGITVGGTIGWWAGSHVGILTAFFLSGLGSMIGVYTGWKINRTYFG